MSVDGKVASGKFQIRLDSQQPRVSFTPFDNKDFGQVIFTAGHCSIIIKGLNSTSVKSRDYARYVETHRDALKDMDFVNWDCFAFEIKVMESHSPPMPVINSQRSEDTISCQVWDYLCQKTWPGQSVIIWMPRPAKDHATTQEICCWMRECIRLCWNDGKPQSHWFTNRNDVQEETRRLPEIPWLYDKPPTSSQRRYCEIVPKDPFFIDGNDYRAHMCHGTRNEMSVQHRLISSVFSMSVVHAAYFERENANGQWSVHVRINAEDKPELSDLMSVSFCCSRDVSKAQSADLSYKGTIIDCSGSEHGDFLMMVRDSQLPARLHHTLQSVIIIIKPNLTSVEGQLNALYQSLNGKVHGDMDGNRKTGFSLRKMILAHGLEMRPWHKDFFSLDLRTHSALSFPDIDIRINTLLQRVSLDPCQLDAFRKSISRITGGVHLIQGPPGTGKTTVSVAIILALSMMRLKVLLTAGSNKAVDNLIYAVYKFLKKNPDLREAVGMTIRSRTPSYILSAVRANSSNTNPLRRTSSFSSMDENMEKIQLYNLVPKYAASHREDRYCSTFNKLAEKDRTHGLGFDEAKGLRGAVESISGYILRQGNTRVVATTLDAAANESLRLNFNPDVLLCDESGQCLESQHLIAMTIPSTKAVILVGDPDQLPPTVISASQGNEQAQYLQRPLMSRLRAAGYEITQLRINYRCHSSILDFFNREVYNGKLEPGPQNDVLERVGIAWDSFISSRSRFRGYNLVGKRRVFVNCPGYAERSEKSFNNASQVQVLSEFLKELYGFTAPSGECVEAGDVLVISPYKKQRDLVKAMLDRQQVRYRDNLSVDASQGQEAPVVFVLLTKPLPPPNAEELGFISDQRRLNVAFSRAKKVLVIIGNLSDWDEHTAKRFASRRKSKMLGKLLCDVVQKEDYLNWDDNSHSQPFLPGWRQTSRKRDSAAPPVRTSSSRQHSASPTRHEPPVRIRSPLLQHQVPSPSRDPSRILQDSTGHHLPARPLHRLPARPPSRSLISDSVECDVESIQSQLSRIQIEIHESEQRTEHQYRLGLEERRRYLERQLRNAQRRS